MPTSNVNLKSDVGWARLIGTDQRFRIALTTTVETNCRTLMTEAFAAISIITSIIELTNFGGKPWVVWDVIQLSLREVSEVFWYFNSQPKLDGQSKMDGICEESADAHFKTHNQSIATRDTARVIYVSHSDTD